MSDAPSNIHPAATGHLPAFVTAPGETDLLLNAALIFLILLVFGVGLLYLRLHALPEHIAHGTSKTQFQVVGVLALLALFTHNHLFWIAALLIALVQLPDYSTPLRSIADSLARLVGRQPPSEVATLPPRAVEGELSAPASADEPAGEPARERRA